jgi:hypothetical protein
MRIERYSNVKISQMTILAVPRLFAKSLTIDNRHANAASGLNG